MRKITKIRLVLAKALLRLPEALRQSLSNYYRYRNYPASKSRHSMYEIAPLLLCPKVAMYKLIPGDIISDAVAHNGFYDWPHTKIMVHEVCKSNGGLLVDVGANLGYFSLLWAGMNSSGKVIAFEASPRNIKLFQRSIEENHVGDQITLIPKALGDRSDSVSFDAGPEEQSGWGGISKVASANTFTVPMVRLDEELPDTPIDLLKIDVEGADTLVLLGCEELLKKKMIKIIYFEQNRERMTALGIAPGEAQNFLLRLGYTCRPISSDEGEWIAYPNNY